MKKYFYILVASIILSLPVAIQAQSLLDGIRLSQPQLGTGTRSFGMGGAMVAATNDYTSLDWNPAALTLLHFGEFSISLWSAGHSSEASFFNNTSYNDLTNTTLASVGAAMPVPTERGHFAFGLSYDRVQDYTNAYAFKAVNPNSSFLNTQGFVNDPGYHGGSYSDYLDELNNYNLAWALYTTYDNDSLNTKLTTPFTGGLQQSGTVTEEGGLYAFRIGAGIDIAEDVALGATLNFYNGTYDYRRVYREEDVNNVFSRTDSLAPLGFKKAEIVDSRYQSQFGIGLKLGMFARANEHLDLGLTFETPTVYDVRDEFFRSGNTWFNYASYTSNNQPSLEGIIINEYDIVTPLKVAAGLAFHLEGATISGGIDYQDMSQLRYKNYAVDLGDLNDKIREELGSVLSWRIGGEYIFAPAKLSLRAGYRVDPSPYKLDPSEYDKKTFSGGIGIVIGKSTLLEFSYQNQSYTTDHSIYNDLTVEGQAASANIDQDIVSRNIFTFSVGFRF